METDKFIGNLGFVSFPKVGICHFGATASFQFLRKMLQCIFSLSGLIFKDFSSFGHFLAKNKVSKERKPLGPICFFSKYFRIFIHGINHFSFDFSDNLMICFP
jgi:hypothetical protein